MLNGPYSNSTYGLQTSPVSTFYRLGLSIRDDEDLYHIFK